MRMALYNFLEYKLPDDIPELLDLLNFFAFWDRNLLLWRVYEKPTDNTRMRWNNQAFKGGTTKEWQQFLSLITTAENLR